MVFLSVLNKLTTPSCRVSSNSLLTIIQSIDVVLLTTSLNKGITHTTEASLPTNVSSQTFHVFKIRNCKSSVMYCQSSWIISLEAHILAEGYFNKRDDSLKCHKVRPFILKLFLKAQQLYCVTSCVAVQIGRALKLSRFKVHRSHELQGEILRNRNCARSTGRDNLRSGKICLKALALMDDD